MTTDETLVWCGVINHMGCVKILFGLSFSLFIFLFFSHPLIDDEKSGFVELCNLSHFKTTQTQTKKETNTHTLTNGQKHSHTRKHLKL